MKSCTLAHDFAFEGRAVAKLSGLGGFHCLPVLKPDSFGLIFGSCSGWFISSSDRRRDRWRYCISRQKIDAVTQL